MLELREVTEEPIKVGEVYLEHEIIVSDPCYDNSACYSTVELPLQGVYDCYYTTITEGLGKAVASIWVVLHDVNTVIKGDEVAACGVDSGQLGIFNASTYRKAVSEKVFKSTMDREFPYESWRRQWEDQKTDEDKFYMACCNLTLSNDSVGILEGVGLVSSSGYGDGAYPLYELEGKDGTVVGFRVDFISNEGEDE